MKKQYLWLAALALGFTACTEDALTPEAPEQPQPEQPQPEQEAPEQTLFHAELSAFAGNQARVNYALTSRADEEPRAGALKLIAEVENPSKAQDGVKGFVKEENGRYLSATCVFYDPSTDTYYATYHMQGNNYNTQLNTDVAGIIESFKVNESGEVTLGQIYRSDNAVEDFDFNHIYFDNVEQHFGLGNVKENRIITVGHRWTPGKTGSGNTQAMIAKINFDGTPSLDYSIVYTGEKILDENGKSLGKEDAQDVNCVIRRYDTYYLATRKGIALLDGKNENLFEPMKDYVGNDYFLKTPGSVKHVAFDGGYSKVTFLYLTEDFPTGFNYETAIPAKIVKFDISNVKLDVNDIGGVGFLGSGKTWSTLLSDVKNDNFLDFVQSDQWNIDTEAVSPVDGKNVLYMPSVGESQYYAALGKAGLMFKNDNHGQYGKENSGRLDFGNRPVNGVFADEGTGSEHHNGFIYVVNGSKLSILNRYRLDEVASYNLPEDEVGSANYVIATTADEYNEFGTRDRIITVAYGQAGLKVFRFSPENTY